MRYQSLSEYAGGWMFEALDSETLRQIKPLSEESARALWERLVSARNRHPQQLAKDEWPRLESTWRARASWRVAWDADQRAVPELFNQIDWPDTQTVYFFYARENGIETTWGAFKQAWKHFLYEDDAPLLLGRGRIEVLCFKPGGELLLGGRSLTADEQP